VITITAFIDQLYGPVLFCSVLFHLCPCFAKIMFSFTCLKRVDKGFEITNIVWAWAPYTNTWRECMRMRAHTCQRRVDAHVDACGMYRAKEHGHGAMRAHPGVSQPVELEAFPSDGLEVTGRRLVRFDWQVVRVHQEVEADVQDRAAPRGFATLRMAQF
jgi:hypothetical protein